MSPENSSASGPHSSERKQWLTLPNAITLLRFLAILPFFYLVTRGRDRAALILFVIAGITDTVDGTIARRLGQISKFGRLADPLVDKLFTGISYVALSMFRPGMSRIPTSVMAAVLSRDVLILAGSLFVYNKSHNSEFRPSIYGKLNTFIEIGVIVCFLAASDLRFVARLMPVFYVILFISIAVSAADYARIGIQMMQRPAANRRRP